VCRLTPARAGLLVVALCGVLASPRPGSAQVVAGIVREAESGVPLPGVLVSALREDGSRVLAVLTDSVGGFVMRLPPGLRVRLRAERIGMETVDTPPFVPGEGDAEPRRIFMGSRALEIEGLTVRTDVQQCRVSEREARVIQRWWDEARKALSVTEVVQESELVRYRIYQFEREWDPGLRTVKVESGRRSTVSSSRPFQSQAPETLLEKGYVQGNAGSRIFVAPDVRVLLSPEFLGSHCFALETGNDTARAVGLRFEPTRSRKETDISGTFWIDTTSSALRFLDYSYANLPADVPGDEAGGRVEFRYLPSGAWIVSRWWVRVPRVGVRTERLRGESYAVYEVAGYVDTGGRADELMTQARGDRAEAWGRLEGIVFDSLSGRPLAGARVQVSGTRLLALTDEAGRFVLDSVPVGPGTVAVFHRDYSAGGSLVPAAEVVVGTDTVVRARLAVPSFATLAGTLCPGQPSLPEAVLTGEVVDDGGSSLALARIQARWQSESGSGGITLERRSEGQTGSDGRFLFCDLPSGPEVELRVWVEDRWRPVFKGELRPRSVLVRRLEVLRASGR